MRSSVSIRVLPVLRGAQERGDEHLGVVAVSKKHMAFIPLRDRRRVSGESVSRAVGRPVPLGAAIPAEFVSDRTEGAERVGVAAISKGDMTVMLPFAIAITCFRRERFARSRASGASRRRNLCGIRFRSHRGAEQRPQRTAVTPASPKRLSTRRGRRRALAETRTDLQLERYVGWTDRLSTTPHRSVSCGHRTAAGIELPRRWASGT
jgi:hypothetical protein